MGNELAVDTNAIKIEANEIYWQTHKISIARDPYARGLTMFEVAQVPLIESLTEKAIKYNELQARAQRIADALEEMAEDSCDYDSVDFAETIHSPNCRACKARELVQQFKDGKEVGNESA